jgi:hypothetical protein
MEDDDDAEIVLNNFLDALDRALAVHEAGHAVVAHELGETVLSIVIHLRTGNGASCSKNFADNIKNLSVCIAGCRAERVLKARGPRSMKADDVVKIRKLLSRFPEAKRRTAFAAGYRLADETLKANADAVRRIADALLARRWIGADPNVVSIEGDELAGLLARAGPA